MWSIMFRRHLDLLVYNDMLPLIFLHFHKPMYAFGDHSTHFRTGCGVLHRHQTVARLMRLHLFSLFRIQPATGRYPLSPLPQPLTDLLSIQIYHVPCHCTEPICLWNNQFSPDEHTRSGRSSSQGQNVHIHEIHMPGIQP